MNAQQPSRHGLPQVSGLLGPVSRGLALFLGAFTLLNLAAKYVTGSDANLWWVDLRALPSALGDSLLGALGLLVCAFAWRPATHGWRRSATTAIAGVFAVVALINAAVFWSLLAQGVIHAGFPVPLSLLVATDLGIIAWAASRPTARPSPRWEIMAVAGLAAVAFPVLQVLCFGKTDYRRPADIGIVFGARVYADGRLSEAVDDRVRQAAELYRQGLVHTLVMSGGPGDGAIHETAAMRATAIRLGVPATAIAVDPAGLNTDATVRNTAALVAGKRALAISEFYHLPRIKLAYARAGLEVFTVPARPRHWQRGWPLHSVVREIPAFWAYYLRGLLTAA